MLYDEYAQRFQAKGRLESVERDCVYGLVRMTSRGRGREEGNSPFSRSLRDTTTGCAMAAMLEPESDLRARLRHISDASNRACPPSREAMPMLLCWSRGTAPYLPQCSPRSRREKNDRQTYAPHPCPPKASSPATLPPCHMHQSPSTVFEAPPRTSPIALRLSAVRSRPGQHGQAASFQGRQEG